MLTVSINDYSLESELVLAGNAALMKSVYLSLHTKSEEKWDKAVAFSSREMQAREIQALFVDTPKGDFAQLLAEAIRIAADFQVPKYLRTAIESLVR